MSGAAFAPPPGYRCAGPCGAAKWAPEAAFHRGPNPLKPAPIKIRGSTFMSVTDKSPLQSTYDPVCWNFKLLAQHELDGFGGMGEGMSIQIAPDGRRIMWLAHESAPKNFTAVDVSDPRKPKVVVQTDLPQPYMRSNSLEITGNIMAVAYQCQK